MTENLLNDDISVIGGKLGPIDSSQQMNKISIKNFSYFGLITCLATLILAFLFKDHLIYLLSYLEEKSTKNIYEFHFILLLLFVAVSLPILWGYLISVLISSYVYSFLYGFFFVVIYSMVGMSCSFYICRYMFYDCAQQRVLKVAYLRAINALIASQDKGFQIIFLSRLLPIPFGLANTLFAVTDVNFEKYMIASVVGLIPSQLILCYMGSTLKSMADVLVNEKTAKAAHFVFIVQLLMAVVIMYYILKAAKNELNKHLDEKNHLHNNKELQNTSLIMSSNDGNVCSFCHQTTESSNFNCGNCSNNILKISIQN
jgi:protein maelstrom